MRKWTLIALWGFFCCLASSFMTGCVAEQGIPLPIKVVGGAPPIKESIIIDLDASGFVNGEFVPDDGEIPGVFPVSYIGKWSPILVRQMQRWTMISSRSPGAKVNVVASASRIIFSFYNSGQYANPGVVTFRLDGKAFEPFPLTSKNAAGELINEYAVITQKTDVATVSMTLDSGQVVIMGYVLVYP